MAYVDEVMDFLRRRDGNEAEFLQAVEEVFDSLRPSTFSNIFFSTTTLCIFFCLLTSFRLSIAKSKISLGKCHLALENMWVGFKYLLI